MILFQFKKNLKAVEDLITKEVSTTIEEVRVALNRINNIIANIDVSVGTIGNSISEIRNVIEKIIDSTKTVTGLFGKSWFGIIIKGIGKGWEFIKNRKKNNDTKGGIE
jgi:hypothetical protein